MLRLPVPAGDRRGELVCAADRRPPEGPVSVTGQPRVWASGAAGSAAVRPPSSCTSFTVILTHRPSMPSALQHLEL